MISLAIHLLPLALLSFINLNLLWQIGIYSTPPEQALIPRSKPIQVDIVEAMPEVQRPLFGRDIATKRTRPRETLVKHATGITREALSPLAEARDAQSLSRPPKTELNLVDPEGFMGLKEPIIDGPGEPSFQDEEDAGDQEKKGERGKGEEGSADIDSQMSDRLRRIAAWMGQSSRAQAVDVAFILDTSGSMEDNIKAVGNHLDEMAASLKSSGLDFRVAVVKFRYLRRDMLVFPFTRDVDRYRRLLRNVRCYGDERALDALWKAMDQLRFRADVERHFILVTDEPLKGSIPFLDVLRRCRQTGIAVTVIGIDDLLHKTLAGQTGGIFLDIPR